MSRNAESHFALNPSIGIQRSKLDLSHDVKTTFDVGQLIPFTWMEVLPGDTFSVDTSKVVRMQTPIVPIMDNIYLDTYYFFVPNRLVWEHWKEFMGENTASAWAPTTTYSVPQITAPSGGWTKGTIADYLGVPTNVSGLSVSALLFRCYSAIANEWFRDENLTDPLYWSVGDATVTGSNGTNYRTDVALGGAPFIAAKLHDYFTSALPGPLKSNQDVQIPLGTFAPVGTMSDKHNFSSQYSILWEPINAASNNFTSGYHNIGYQVLSNDLKTGYTRLDDATATAPSSYTGAYPANLYADLSNASAATINSLRLAFQIQKLLEKDARNGSRYIEIIKGHFNVTSPDARLQRPEYLGGNRIPLNIHTVLATAETTNTDLGQTGAYSMTVDSHSDFTRSFTEHGYIIGLMVARYTHSYQQGLERMWTRKDRLDYYWPVLANIGELPIRNDQIYAQGTSVDSQIFGYQEAWAEYRYKPNYVTGEMRSNVQTSLDAWHLADDYSQLPTLSDGWIREDKTNVDRALMVQSSVSNQIFADIYIKNHATRPMPVFSIPGLIDHH